MTNETTLQEELKAQIEGKRFVRAAALAKSAALPLSEVKDLQEKALWQMAAVFRNAGAQECSASSTDFPRKRLRTS